MESSFAGSLESFLATHIIRRHFPREGLRESAEVSEDIRRSFILGWGVGVRVFLRKRRRLKRFRPALRFIWVQGGVARELERRASVCVV